MFFEKYYEQLENIHVNTCPNRAYFVPSAKGMPCECMEDSPVVTMLSGEDWLFKLYDTPYDVEKFFSEDFDSDDYHEIPVPSCWQTLGYDHHQYETHKYPFPYDPPYIPEENLSGAYIKYFDVDEDQLSMKNYLNFEGVDSCYYVWINGKFVGYSQVAHSTSEFDVSDFLCEGENKLAVLVLKWCTGTYLEDQDKLRMSGIFRDVYIMSRPTNHIVDYTVKTPVSEDYKDAKVKITATWDGTPEKTTVTLKATCGAVLESKEMVDGVVEFDVKDAKLWNAEDPYQYIAVIETENEVIVQKVGIRKFEVKGNVFYVNGVKVKFKGVNRHDSDPFTGYTISREQLLKDLALMKQHNVNGIRTSHYPNAPWATQYYNEFGFYVVDESDFESQGTLSFYGSEHSRDYYTEFCDDRCYSLFCHDKRFEESIVDRIQRNVVRDKNNASVVLWSLGNESGYGPNLEKAAAWIKEYDPDMLVHYEGSIYQIVGYKNDVSNIDVYSRMYAPVDASIQYVTGMIDKPYMECEFVHAMGNGPGDIEDYFEAIYAHDGFLGGFVWEWCDHAIYMGQTPEGKAKYNYGGDWNDFPNSGNFCMDGLVYPDRRPHTGLLEWKNVARPGRGTAVDLEKGIVKISNKLDFMNLKDVVTAYYEISQNGDVIEGGELPELDIEAHCEKEFTLGYKIPETGDVHLKIVYLQKEDVPFIDAGYEIGFDQLTIREVSVEKAPIVKGEFAVESDDRYITIEGGNFEYKYNKIKGTFDSMVKDNKTIIAKPMEYNIWRAPTDNDRRIREEWQKAGYHRQVVKVYGTEVEEKDGTVVITSELSIAALYIQRILMIKSTWTIDAEGTVNVVLDAEKQNEFAELPFLPRFGLRMFLPKEFKDVEYYGYGPDESYIDKRRNSYYGRFETTVEKLHEDYIMPQENGSHWGCKEVNVSLPSGYKVSAKAEGFSFNASEYTQEELTAKGHNYELEKSGYTVLCLDAAMSGIGSGSCGPQLSEKYQVVNGKILGDFELKFGK